MTIWSSKGAIAALALIGLAACEDGQGGIFQQVLDAPKDGKQKPVVQAKMAFGAVTLVAPKGYCIDDATLRQTFALMALCETLDAPSTRANAPVGVITASFASAQDTLPSPSDTAKAHDLGEVSDAKIKGASVTFRAKGPPAADGFSIDHWRGTAQVGNQVMGLALFGPEGGRATGPEGRAVLTELIAASGAGS